VNALPGVIEATVAVAVAPCSLVMRTVMGAMKGDPGAESAKPQSLLDSIALLTEPESVISTLAIDPASTPAMVTANHHSLALG